MKGFVSPSNEILLRVEIEGPSGIRHEVDAVVDTGFTEELALPHSLLDAVESPPAGFEETILGDGSIASLPIHPIRVFWSGEALPVRAYAVESGALLGMRLLRGHRLTVEVRPGGIAEIERL